MDFISLALLIVSCLTYHNNHLIIVYLHFPASYQLIEFLIKLIFKIPNFFFLYNSKFWNL